ncbi:HAD domain-containing protein [Dyella telluris]|uniref:Uncharacterized protein n=1 Tax=Dyella telluris TaxID=2763498 RepID=A0A7G8Q3M1_9GAMM|nr:hypothetical protein H8F01_20455 [Dyella telluris]
MLDFDGVLHAADAGADTYFTSLSELESVLRDLRCVDVVIVSSWRHIHSLDKLRTFFSQDLRHRIVGVTPDIAPAAGSDDRGSRQREIEAWLARIEGPGLPWVALDDVASLYDPGAPVLVTPNGFGHFEAAALRAALSDPVAFGRRCASAC